MLDSGVTLRGEIRCLSLFKVKGLRCLLLCHCWNFSVFAGLFVFFGSNKKQKLVNPRIPQPRYLPQNSQRDTSVLCVDILF